jgi:hypothetical protein
VVNNINIQWVIKYIAGYFRIDISSTGRELQGLQGGRRINRSFGLITPFRELTPICCQH